jgi:RNA-binding protein
LLRLGKVLLLTDSRNLILKTMNVPKMGSLVVDQNLNKIGKVIDIFGQVNNPYIKIQPTIKNANKYIGNVLYVINSKETRYNRSYF